MRYGLDILNYTVTSNHVHLLVKAGHDLDTIPKSMQLIAGQTAQQYNRRKSRKGAFWEDRYHATAVQDGEHLARCLVYIDMNMVRAGVVRHPSDWKDGGYREIFEPSSGKKIVSIGSLLRKLHLDRPDDLRVTYSKWITEIMAAERQTRDERWTESLAVGEQSYIDRVSKDLEEDGLTLRRSAVYDSDGVTDLREPVAHYGIEFDFTPENMSFEGELCEITS